jgi:hypothetical protein
MLIQCGVHSDGRPVRAIDVERVPDGRSRAGGDKQGTERGAAGDTGVARHRRGDRRRYGFGDFGTGARRAM